MNKNKKINIMITMIVITFVLLLCGAFKMHQLKHENTVLIENNIELEDENTILKDENTILKENNIEEYELTSCHLCNGNVKIKPVNESFYIECEECKLRTDFFDSKSDLIKYWNKE